MYDTLLFLHLLGAFITFITVVVFSAYAVGIAPSKGSFALGDWAWNVSGVLLLVFGVWLALYVDGYELWDGWILGAIVLLGIATAFGARARDEVLAQLGEGGEPTAAMVNTWHWLRTASVVAILVLMVWKPGA